MQEVSENNPEQGSSRERPIHRIVENDIARFPFRQQPADKQRFCTEPDHGKGMAEQKDGCGCSNYSGQQAPADTENPNRQQYGNAAEEVAEVDKKPWCKIVTGKSRTHQEEEQSNRRTCICFFLNVNCHNLLPDYQTPVKFAQPLQVSAMNENCSRPAGDLRWL